MSTKRIGEVVIGMSVDAAGVRVGLQQAAADTQRNARAMSNELRTQTNEARGAAKLLGEELGVRLNRHLANVLAKSQLLGPVFAAAFPIAAGIGFIDVVGRIPEAIAKITDEIFGLTEKQKEQNKEAVEGNKELVQLAEARKKLEIELGEIGMSAAQKTESAIRRLRDEQAILNKELLLTIQQNQILAEQAMSSTGSKVSAAGAGLSLIPGGDMLSTAVDFYAEMFQNPALDKAISHNNDQIVKLQQQIANTTLEIQKMQKQLGVSFSQDASKALDEINAIYAKADQTFLTAAQKQELETAGTLGKLAEMWSKYPAMRQKIEDAVLRVVQVSDEKQLDAERNLQQQLLNFRMQANAKAFGTIMVGSGPTDVWAANLEKVKDIERDFNQELETERSLEQSITAEAATGAMTQYESQAKLRDIRRDAQAQLADMLQKMRDINVTLKDPDVAAKMQQMQAQMDALRFKAASLKDTLSQAFQKSFADGFVNVVTMTETVAQAFRRMATAVLGELARMAAQWILTHLIMKAFSMMLGTTEQETAAASVATNNSANFAKGASAAGLAAANTFAWWSAVFPPDAPGMAALAYAEGMGFATLTAFHGGGIASDEQIAKLKRNEMVMDPSLSAFIQDRFNDRSGGSSDTLGLSVSAMRDLTSSHNELRRSVDALTQAVRLR